MANDLLTQTTVARQGRPDARTTIYVNANDLFEIHYDSGNTHLWITADCVAHAPTLTVRRWETDDLRPYSLAASWVWKLGGDGEANRCDLTATHPGGGSPVLPTLAANVGTASAGISGLIP